MLAVGAGEVMAGQAGEDLQRAGRGRLGAGTLLGVKRQLGDVAVLHGGAEVAFDQAAAQQRDELAEEERFDALGVLEQHGRGTLLSW